MSGKILAIDPGNEMSGYVVVEHNGKEITSVLECGKVSNSRIYDIMTTVKEYELAIEMIQSMGMAVGQTVFDTCVWIGRLSEYADYLGIPFRYVFRREEKEMICGTMKAKDANIRQALIDRFAPGEPNGGKGTKKIPGFFYGFKADIWQAFAVAVVYFEKYVKEDHFPDVGKMVETKE